MLTSLQDRTVLVVGRGGGIARAVTLAARNARARVVAAGRDRARLTAVYDDLGITTAEVDVTDEASVAALADRIGTVDHVVSTASARASGSVGKLDPGVVAVSFQTTVIGPVLLVKAPRSPDARRRFLRLVLRRLVAQAHGGPVGGRRHQRSRRRPHPFTGDRAGTDTRQRHLAGTIDTGAYDALGEHDKAALFARRTELNPARRIGTTEDIADAVLFALTNTFLTGVSLLVDGGEHLV